MLRKYGVAIVEGFWAQASFSMSFFMSNEGKHRGVSVSADSLLPLDYGSHRQPLQGACACGRCSHFSSNCKFSVLLLKNEVSGNIPNLGEP